MDGQGDDNDHLITLASRRLDFLDRLADVALEKREMVEELGHSRSTVNRAVAELEDTGLVTATDDGHVTTLTGKLAADMYHRVATEATDIRAASGVLAPLSADSPIGLELISRSDVERTDGPPPYESLEQIRDTFRSATRVRAIVPTIANVETLRVCHSQVLDGEMTAEVIMKPDLYDRLTTQFPSVMRELVLNQGSLAVTGGLPQFATFLIEENGTVTVAVIVYTENNAIHGTLFNDTVAAVRWAEDLWDRLRAEATERAEELQALDSGVKAQTHERTADASTRERSPEPTTKKLPESSDDGASSQPSTTTREQPAIRNDSVRIDLEANGFVKLDPGYFAQRKPAPPAVSLRSGMGLVEVSAGYAIDREFVRDGERLNLTDFLLEQLGDGRDYAVIGPPGSGKSTTCKSIACRWYEQRQGPVLYRESGYDKSFDSPAVLREYLRQTSGHALVVVEDAVRAEANAVFELMEQFSGDRGVTFLLDARESEWQQPEEFPTDASLETYRHEVVETFVMPELDETECRRLVDHFEDRTEDTVEPPVEELLDHVRSEAKSGETIPGGVLLLLHRLSAYGEPLAKYESRMPTTLTEDVQRTYENLANDEEELALDVGVLVNLLNAAGIGVYPELVHALADEAEHDEIRAVLSSLEGRIIWSKKEGESRSSRYRSIHESWSQLFLKHLLTNEPEREARERFGRCVSALLSLADDGEKRERIDWEFEGDTAYLDEVMVAPGEWSDDIVRRIFTLGLEHPHIARLFGKSKYSYIELPEAASADIALRCVEWRGKMHLRAGAHDWAIEEFQRLEELAENADDIDAGLAKRLVAMSLNKRSEIVMHQGSLDSAEEFATRAKEQFNELGDRRGEANSLLRLGIISWNRGAYESAQNRLTQSLERYREIGNTRDKSVCLGNLARVALDRGDIDAARKYATECKQQRPALGAKLDEAESLLLLGKIELREESYDAAEEYVTQSLEIAQNIGARHTEGNSLLMLGEIAQDREDLTAAIEYLNQSLEIWSEMSFDHGKAECLKKLGTINMRRQEYENAEKYLTQSLKLVREVGDKRWEAETLQALGDIARENEEYQLARDRYEMALEISRDIEAKQAILRTLERLIELCEVTGEIDVAINHCETALKLARQFDLEDEYDTFNQELDRLSEEMPKRSNRE